MPTATKVGGVSASSLADGSLPYGDFKISEEALRAALLQDKSGAKEVYVVDPRDGASRVKINVKKLRALSADTLEKISLSPSEERAKVVASYVQEGVPVDEALQKTTPESASPSSVGVDGNTPAETGLERSRQVADLVQKGMSLDSALEKTKPGTSQEGVKNGGVKTDPVITLEHNVPDSSPKPSGSGSHSAPGPSAFVAAQSAAISQDVSYRASVNGPSLRHDLFGWGNFKANQLIFNPIRRAFGRPEQTFGGSSSSTSPASQASATSREVGLQSTGVIGRTASPSIGGASPGVGQSTSVTTGASGGSSGPRVGESRNPSGPSAEHSSSSSKVAGEGSQSLKSSSSKLSGNSLKSGILSAAGNKLGGAAGMVGKIKGAINTVQLAGRAAAGDVSAMIQLGVKGLKWAWNNKERLIKIGAGIMGGGLLYLYGLVAPWLSMLSPAALAGAGIGGAVGFLVGGPIGMAIGIPLGAFIGANWAGIVAGVGNALASIGGAIAAVGSGIAGLVGAITSSAAAAIGVLSALTIGGAAIFVAVPEATRLEIWGQSETVQAQLAVQKTATPDKIANDQPGSVVYKISLTNDSGIDIPIKISDRTVKVYGKAAAKTITMPNPTTALPTVIPKANNSGNPLVITYSPLAIPATIYNDSQIVNTVTVEADDPQTKQKKSYTAEATVVIGSIEDDHPYGFPASGWLSSVDTEPCNDHQGVFYGIAGVVKGGLDIVGAPNSVVISTLDGTVTAAKWDESSYSVGGYVYITSKSGNFVAAFLHMNTPIVKAGDEIKRGQPIGTIYPKKLPTTGGPHVHYQVIQRVNGQWVNAAFSDPARAGSCLADPSDSPEANISPRVLIAPSYTQAGCSAVPRVYVMKDSVQQDVSCVK